MIKDTAVQILLEHFSEGMVRTIVDAIAQDEREECAKIIDDSYTTTKAGEGIPEDWLLTLSELIRARGQAWDDCLPIYTTLQQRKPLTDEEIRKFQHHMVSGAYQYSFMQGVRYAESAHGIKE